MQLECNVVGEVVEWSTIGIPRRLQQHEGGQISYWKIKYGMLTLQLAWRKRNETLITFAPGTPIDMCVLWQIHWGDDIPMERSAIAVHTSIAAPTTYIQTICEDCSQNEMHDANRKRLLAAWRMVVWECVN